MRAYPDSSFLVAAYWFTESDSARATRWLQKQTEPVVFTPLHRHEVRTALRLKEFRGETTKELRMQAFQELDSDLADRILIHTPISWTDAFREADILGEAHGSEVGARSLDLLHVGIALALKAEQFLTFDDTQREIARRAGMKVSF